MRLSRVYTENQVFSRVVVVDNCALFAFSYVFCGGNLVATLKSSNHRCGLSLKGGV